MTETEIDYDSLEGKKVVGQCFRCSRREIVERWRRTDEHACTSCKNSGYTPTAHLGFWEIYSPSKYEAHIQEPMALLAKPAKKLFYFYQRAMWYFGVAVGEAKKPLVLWNETALATLLLEAAGVHLTIGRIALAYVVLAVGAIIAGKLLVTWGIVVFNQSLINEQNAEIMEILERVKGLENRKGIVAFPNWSVGNFTTHCAAHGQYQSMDEYCPPCKYDPCVRCSGQNGITKHT